MGIEEFDPISQPKRLKSAAKLRALPENKKPVSYTHLTLPTNSLV